MWVNIQTFMVFAPVRIANTRSVKYVSRPPKCCKLHTEKKEQDGECCQLSTQEQAEQQTYEYTVKIPEQIKVNE